MLSFMRPKIYYEKSYISYLNLNEYKKDNLLTFKRFNMNKSLIYKKVLLSLNMPYCTKNLTKYLRNYGG